jgi:hypothetical protein
MSDTPETTDEAPDERFYVDTPDGPVSTLDPAKVHYLPGYGPDREDDEPTED